MTPARHRLAFGSRRGLIATVATGALLSAAATGLVFALVGQKHEPQPPIAVAPSTSATAHPTPAKSGPVTRGPLLAPSIPLTISIPAINVESALQKLGRAANGTLAVPAPGPLYDTAGWYQYSPTPGALGPAVIAGHVDSATAGPSIFFRLGGLRAHDIVRITRADGTVAIFTVDSVLRYHKRAFPTELVYGNTDHAALRLITCGGPFDSATGHYTDNIVVFASLTTFTQSPAHDGDAGPR